MLVTSQQRSHHTGSQGPTVYTVGKPGKQRLPQLLPQTDPDSGRCDQGTSFTGMGCSDRLPTLPLAMHRSLLKEPCRLGLQELLPSPLVAVVRCGGGRHRHIKDICPQGLHGELSLAAPVSFPPSPAKLF